MGLSKSQSRHKRRDFYLCLQLIRYFCNAFRSSIYLVKKVHSFKIYTSVADIPQQWDVVAAQNIFIKADYLSVLEKAAPENMTCRYIGIFVDSELGGVAVSQFISM